MSINDVCEAMKMPKLLVWAMKRLRNLVIEVQGLYMRLDMQAMDSVVQENGISVILRKQDNENGDHSARYYAVLFFYHRFSDESSWLTRAASTSPAF